MSDNKPLNVICPCGKTIQSEDIIFHNSTNELGEEYYEGQADCSCGQEFEWSEWGECEDINQAKNDLIEHIKEVYQTNDNNKAYYLPKNPILTQNDYLKDVKDFNKNNPNENPW